MEVGDLVKTKVPGFGTGDRARLGTIVGTKDGFTWRLQIDNLPVQVMHDDGTFLEWYPWQLERLSERD